MINMLICYSFQFLLWSVICNCTFKAVVAYVWERLPLSQEAMVRTCTYNFYYKVTHIWESAVATPFANSDGKLREQGGRRRLKPLKDGCGPWPNPFHRIYLCLAVGCTICYCYFGLSVTIGLSKWTVILFFIIISSYLCYIWQCVVELWLRERAAVQWDR